MPTLRFESNDDDERTPSEVEHLRAENARLRRERDAWLDLLLALHPDAARKELTTR